MQETHPLITFLKGALICVLGVGIITVAGLQLIKLRAEISYLQTRIEFLTNIQSRLADDLLTNSNNDLEHMKITRELQRQIFINRHITGLKHGKKKR